jgi:hypothetical protein
MTRTSPPVGQRSPTLVDTSGSRASKTTSNISSTTGTPVGAAARPDMAAPARESGLSA